MSKVSSFESIIMTTAKPGYEFYTKMKDKDITARASYYGKKVKTERIVAMARDGEYKVNVEYITKVTML